MIRLICIDLDGTLLNDRFEIPVENREAILSALDIGINIALVSGRPYCITRYFAESISDKICPIGSNGTFFRHESMRYGKKLDKAEIKEILDKVEKHDLTIQFKGADFMTSNKRVEPDHQYRLINRKAAPDRQMRIYESADRETILNLAEEGIFKTICFNRDPGCIESVFKAKKELQETDRFEVVSSHVQNFEVMKKGTSKGKAVEVLGCLLGIFKAEIMAIGDNENDISMFNAAGVRIAMGNASEELKELSDHIVGNNIESGVAEAIRNHCRINVHAQ